MKVLFEPVWKIFWDSSSLSFNCEIGLLKWNPIWFFFLFVSHSLSISWIFIGRNEIKLWESETLLLCWISINMLMTLMIGDLTSRIGIPLKLLVFFLFNFYQMDGIRILNHFDVWIWEFVYEIVIIFSSIGYSIVLFLFIFCHFVFFFEMQFRKTKPILSSMPVFKTGCKASLQ